MKKNEQSKSNVTLYIPKGKSKVVMSIPTNIGLTAQLGHP
jgi:hypothetical protein